MANAVRLFNASGRPLDDLDILKMHVYAQEAARGASYSVSSADGHPICGFVTDKPVGNVSLTNLTFSAQVA